jgi:hypothetical protein
MMVFASNYLNLLKAQMESLTQDQSNLSDFFISGAEIAAICLPFKQYCRKLASLSATLAVRFAAVDNATQMLAF